MTTLLELTEVTKTYGNITAVRNVSIDARSGEILGIVGPSGCGKTTMLRIMDLLETPSSGSVEVLGRRVPADSREADRVRLQIGMVLQKPIVLNRSVAHNLSYPLELRELDTADVTARMSAELERIGLADRAGKNAKTLSGGEMQRLSFARATLYDPKILLLDEFTANLDPSNVGMLENDVRRFVKEDDSRAVIIVTHSMFQAKRLCHRVALMWDGELVEVAEKRKFFEDPDNPKTAGFVKGELVY